LAREEQQNYRPDRPITREEVKEALKKMKSGKAVGLDSIPVEVWKYLGEDGVAWLTDFFDVISNTAKMPHEWRHSVITPCTRTKEMLKTATIIGVLSYLVTLRSYGSW